MSGPSGTQEFDELTHWHKRPTLYLGREPGWRPAAGAFADNISRSDPYWGRVLDKAKAAYGDPNIHYNTGDPNQDRYLVFGDGTPLPADGSLAYRNNGRTYLLNENGSVSPLDANGQAGQPIFPAGYRKVGDHYAPIDEHGQQVAPQLPGVPSSDNGFYTDPKTGWLTPKNANGDSFTLGPDGKKSFFAKNGAPITQDQYDKGTDSPAPGAPPPPPSDPNLPTDEQQSGKTADAVKQLQGELSKNYSKISDAERGLSEVLLNAHAANAAGQQRLNAIQEKIIGAANNPAMSIDTPAGERSFLTFLHGQVGDIDDMLAAGSLTADDQAKTAKALANLYAVDDSGSPGGGSPDPSTPQQQPAPPAPPTPPPAADPGGDSYVDPGAPADPGLGPEPPMPDPTLSDVLGGGPLGAGMGPDPMSSLASMLPGALGGLGGLGGAPAIPLDGLSGLAGAAEPLAGLASQAAGQVPDHDHSSDTTEKPDDTHDQGKDGKDGKGPAAGADKTDPTDKTDPAGKHPDSTQQPGGQQDQQQTGTPPPGGPPAAVAPPAPPTSTVKLPDGSTANARTPAAAQAVGAYLAGDTISGAYGKNGLQLPPPGTPVTSPVDPSRLACGDVGIFKDHYVVALSSVKAFVNGQVVALGSVSSSPDFLGWIDPTAAAAGAAPPAVPPAQPPPPAPPGLPPPANALADAPPAAVAG